MAPLPSISFSKSVSSDASTLVLFLDSANACGPAATGVLAGVSGGIGRALATSSFTGKAGSLLEILAPSGLTASRLLLVGIGEAGELDAKAALKLGGQVYGKLKDFKVASASILFEAATGELAPELAAEFALGLRLRAYDWDKYKTKKKDETITLADVEIVATNAGKAKKVWAEALAVAEGVELARNLVNESPNHLGPQDFASEAGKLEKLGVDVEVLSEKDMKKLGMGSLLAVGQGSARPPRLVIMRWNGAKDSVQPVAFIGKGVVFDSGGISIKPAANMEDMKGDMAGAAAVVGLMKALAGRKAKVNAIGVIGLVENLPDGNSYRPGDILTSMSGQTIEIVNTDAEGRLVLADALWYTQDRFKPQFMVNLATLTGAITVALGNQIAGLFSNDDALAGKLAETGDVTGERLWRMPLSAEFDKAIDSRFADMKNSGGRLGGASTAAQFLKRFVNDTPWAHLDIAGTAMGSVDTDINRSWGSGFGVRLLDRLVRDHYES
ncbi:leucyl aminopeptidase [Oryzibacter oryziterrae]|uniref:leucyl aminopeptidase n=1 Tax=Oryzibacter oryziterrae TaxID=2766474 RepID=UPI001F027B1F|nr:leucyl aminopeptidase [Oryzibacter oryziterrae]